jgi:6-phosphogluconolactonase
MLRVFDDLEALSQAAAEFIITAGQSAIDEHGRFDWLLAGGGTPRRAYELLAAGYRREQDLWSRTHVYWGDERCVPPDHPDSNYAMARQALLDHLPIPAEQVHRVPAELTDPRAAADQYEAILPERADLIVLGMGEDGHTASLFPHSPALNERGRRVIAVEGTKPPKDRITITPPVLEAAREVLVLVSGIDKAPALERVLDEYGTVDRTPARLARDALWFADRAAASAVLEFWTA